MLEGLTFSSLYSPKGSVTVPFGFPLTITFAPGIGIPLLSVTFPITVFCPKTVAVEKIKNSIVNLISFIFLNLM